MAQLNNIQIYKKVGLMTIKQNLIIAALFAITFAAGCRKDSGSEKNADAAKKNSPSSVTLKIVATTGQINDAVNKLTEGTNATVKLFCGPGVDPHSFSASTQDVQAMLDSDLIIYNGFHLEAKLSEHLHGTFEDKSWAMSSAFPESNRLDWVEDGEVDPEAPFDPHIWNHLSGWSECVRALSVELGKADPDNALRYKENANAYIDEILATHQWAREKLATLPEQTRTIVSAHDAFNYFAIAYNMKTLAVLGVGNDAEADIKTMRTVAEEICSKKIPAIFMESINNPKVTQALQEACTARDWEVELVSQPLYSDDLGELAPLNTFLGAFKSNVNIIFESLNK